MKSKYNWIEMPIDVADETESNNITARKKRRKPSLKYIVWMVFCILFFIGLTLELALYYRIFEKFDKAEVIGQGNEIVYVVDGKEYRVKDERLHGNVNHRHDYNGKIDYILYQVSNPIYTFTSRGRSSMYFFIVFDALFFIGMILLTVIEIKKGCDKIGV